MDMLQFNWRDKSITHTPLLCFSMIFDSEQEDHVTNLLSYYSRVIDITQERDGWADCIYLLKFKLNSIKW